MISRRPPGASIKTLSGGGNVTLGAKTLTLTKGNGIFSGVISGSGALTVDGSGTETLSGINTYTGATTIGSGETLALSGAGSIVASSGVADSGTFDISGTTGASIKTLSGGGNVNLGGETLTLTAGAGIFSGVISGSGALTVDGSGTETLSGANTYSGATTIGSGETLALSGSGSIAASSGVTDSGTFDISGTTGASIKTLSGGGNVNLGGETLTLTKGNDTFSGVISGNGGLTVDGIATDIETLSGINTYTGATTIGANETLALSNGGSIATSSGVTDHGTFDITNTTSGASIKTLSGDGAVDLGAKTLTLTKGNDIFSGVISGSGGLTVDGTGTETLSGIDTYTGATTIGSNETLALSGSGSIAASSGVADSGIFDISATTAGASITTLSGGGNVTLGTKTLTLTKGNDIFSGVISGSGGLTVDGTGTETLSGIDTYTGATTINSGATLALSGSGSIAASSGVADSGIFDISGTTAGASIVTLSGGGTVKLGAETLTLSNASTTFSGTIGVAGDTGGVTVTAGTETLNNGTINGGTLTVDGTLDSTGVSFITDTTIINPGNIHQISGTLTIDPSPFTNTGTFEVGGAVILSGEVVTNSVTVGQTTTNGTFLIDKTGTLTLDNSTINGGTIIDNGTLLFTGTTSKLENVTFSGAATLDISSHSTLEIGGSVSSGVTVKFDQADGQSELILDDSHDFKGTIAGLTEASTERPRKQGRSHRFALRPVCATTSIRVL